MTDGSSTGPSPVWEEYQGARTGTDIECEGWRQEAALRMLNNNLDPDVAEDPENLVVYGGIGQAARSWDAYETIVEELRSLADDQTLLVQSGKPVGRLQTHERAPRVLIANTNLVSKYDTWEHFRDLDEKGLMMMANYTAGSWGYIGTQGVLQGTYETLAEVGRQHFPEIEGLRGKIVATAGLGGMGGNQPLAVTMNQGVCIVAEVSEERIDRRIETGYCQEKADNLDEAIERAREHAERGKPYSVAVPVNAVKMLESMLDRGIFPDVLTDMTTAHDELNGYYPLGYTTEEADQFREEDPDRYVEEALDTMERHVDAIIELQDRGTVAFAYGNNIRGQVADHRDGDEPWPLSGTPADERDPFDFPGFVPAYVRPLFCRGKGPFRWVALSGKEEDIYRTDELVREMFPDDESLHRWIDLAQEQVEFQGLPARICWLGQRAEDDKSDEPLSERARFALRVNELVGKGELSAPVVVTRDQLDGGSVASPTRATEDMKDGSDAVADWPILNALTNCAAGADIVSVHGSAGSFGLATSSNNHVVLDGSDLAAEKARTVLDADPSTAVLRHADAGYEEAIEEARESDVHVPMRETGPLDYETE
ncbi:urocanate hydratase [Halosolutus amylolyticus]|uniref:Probable urocanate hydratase n=1 Tax=Halosolutus amylolyticus TaxID=2932267 RepID=A0ABD5PIZ8_9EURY|nr:urocanate hydratase [Halosolutus amylolyticus]